jgi:hypothetical protein
MSNLARQYLQDSELDFIGQFSNLWIGFNSWYKDIHPNQRDQQGCLLMEELFSSFVEAQLRGLNGVDEFITQQVDSLAICQCNGYTYSHDVSGFKFRLQCQNQCTITKFLQIASKHPSLKPYTVGLRFFESIGRPDPLFQNIYRKYRNQEASEDGIFHSADAGRISSNLAQIGVEHYGHMLFHNLKVPTSTSLYSLDDIYGSGRNDLLATINTQSRKGTPNAFGDNSPESRASDLLKKAPTITSLYLYVLYKFRCVYFHGNLDPLIRENQNLAKAAFFSLRELIEAHMLT